MPKIIALDSEFPIARQLELQGGPIVLLTTYRMNAEDEDIFLKALKHDNDFMQAQAGHLSTVLCRALGGSATYMATSTWRSVEDLRLAFTNPEHHARAEAHPASLVCTPHIFHAPAAVQMV